MMQLQGTYFDGKSARSIPVSLKKEGNELIAVGEDILLSYAINEVQIDSPLGSLHRMLHLPDGGQIKCEDHEILNLMFPRRQKIEAVAHFFEKRWGYVVLALLLTAAFTWCSVFYGLPFAAKHIAFHIPSSAETSMSSQILDILDRSIFKPSKLSEERQRQLQQSFSQFTVDLNKSTSLQLQFRSSSIGPNAFALPGGIIIMTDQLVHLAKNDKQLLAVLAHEIGHIQGRHALRNTIQNAGISILLSAVIGDVASMTTTVITMLPTMLLQSGYSRQFESEADDYAFAYLRQHDISPKAFAEIIDLLRKSRDGKEGKESGGYFATHPDSDERIRKALEQQYTSKY